MTNDQEAIRPSKGATAVDVYQYAQALLSAGDSEGWADMFAADGVFEMPFAPPDQFGRLKGPDAIKQFLAPVQRKVRELYRSETTDRRVYETDDPEVVICEFVSHRTVIGTGETHRMPYVHIVRIRDGEIVSFRDFMSFHLAPRTGSADVLRTLKTTAS
jgi:ketosteroid isomerase-like protein